MLPQRYKTTTIQSTLSKMNSQRPFSILSIGLIGQQKQKTGNKTKTHNDKKMNMKEKHVKINDENHNYSNYISQNSINSNLKGKDLYDTVFQKVNMSQNFNTTSGNLDIRTEVRLDEVHFFKPSSIQLQEITNQMIEESEEKLLVKKDHIFMDESMSKNLSGVVNLSKKIKKLQKPKHFFKAFEADISISPLKLEE